MRQLFGNGLGQLGSTIKLGADAPSGSRGADRSARRSSVPLGSSEVAGAGADIAAGAALETGAELPLSESAQAERPKMQTNRPVKLARVRLVIIPPTFIRILGAETQAYSLAEVVTTVRGARLARRAPATTP
jgi:hypothetical protein